MLWAVSMGGRYMFSGAAAFNQDISSWQVDRITNMTHMFSGATYLVVMM